MGFFDVVCCECQTRFKEAVIKGIAVYGVGIVLILCLSACGSRLFDQEATKVTMDTTCEFPDHEGMTKEEKRANLLWREKCLQDRQMTKQQEHDSADSARKSEEDKQTMEDAKKLQEASRTATNKGLEKGRLDRVDGVYDKHASDDFYELNRRQGLNLTVARYIQTYFKEGYERGYYNRLSEN